jgi:hypothetical protein
MKLSLNKEYAMRHLAVAALFFALAGWFLYDAVFVYPNLPPDAPHHTTVEFQYSFAALLAAVAFTVAFRVWRSWRGTLEWDDERMRGSLAGGRELKFADVSDVDDRLWKKKGILVLRAADGRRVTLDTWHHAGADDLAGRFLRNETEKKGEEGDDDKA